MANEMTEIRWHGRGGQGAKTAAQLVARVALSEGKHSQGFPEYGPERAGAPVRGFTRVSESEIRLHCPIERPDVVVILDDMMLAMPAVTEGVDEDTVFVVNTVISPAATRQRLKAEVGNVYCVDATGISIDELGRPMPNTPMVGALVRATGCISLDTLQEQIKQQFQKKFGERVVQGNLQAIRRAHEEVRS